MKNTVGIVLLTHSNDMTEAFIKFCEMLKQGDFNLINGGKSNEKYGTTVDILIEAIRKANRGKGVLALVDFGSSIMNLLKAKEILKDEIQVEIADAPFIEGSISAIVANDENMDLMTLKNIAEDSRNSKKIKTSK